MAGGPFITEQKRKRIIKLYESTTLSLYEIAEVLRITQPTVSRVLKEYRNGGIQFKMEAGDSPSN